MNDSSESGGPSHRRWHFVVGEAVRLSRRSMALIRAGDGCGSAIQRLLRDRTNLPLKRPGKYRLDFKGSATLKVTPLSGF